MCRLRHRYQLYTQSAQHPADRVKAWTSSTPQRFVQGLTTDTCLFGNLGHTTCFSDIAKAIALSKTLED